MTIEDPELLAEFVIESQEHLAEVESELLTLEAQPDRVDTALVNKVFRAVHSIKGAAGFFGQQTLETLAHRGEEVLNRLRNNEIRPTHQVISTLLAATDRLKGLLDNIEDSNNEDVSEHVIALEKLLKNEADGQPSQQTPVSESQTTADQEPCDAAKSTTSKSLNQKTQQSSNVLPRIRASGIGEEALRDFLIESCDNLEQIERDLVSFEDDPTSESLVNSIFRSMHTIKGSAGFLAFNNLERLAHACETLLGKIRLGERQLESSICNLLFATVDSMQKCLQRIEQDGQEGCFMDDNLIEHLLAACESGYDAGAGREGDFTDDKVIDPMLAACEPGCNVGGAGKKESDLLAVNECRELQSDASLFAPRADQPVDSAKSTAVQNSSADETQVKSAADSTIRVDVALLDKLMTRVGELVLARNQIMQFTSSLGDSELLNTSQRLNLITTELQEGVMKTRMQPIGNVWSKFPRIVRDLSSTCGKQVRIEMHGKDTELDKTIIEAIKDPLTHLVRNSVDHGIETPSDRVKMGKPAEGCLRLRAFHEGGQVNIEISDDGAGLNPAKLKAKARDRNLITAEQAEQMQDHEANQLIFLPGFSTAERVSNVSGRGVGMDVVKTNIEKIGGMVDIQSQVGRGTTIKIKIPLTLAIIPALTITNDGNRFAIPQVNLLELVRLDGEDAQSGIEWIQGAPVHRLRGRLLPLVYLRKLLQTGDDRDEVAEAINIVVLRADDRQFGLVVDRINDTEEIVVKALSKQLKAIPVYSGTTIMGDGKVALILDVLGLAYESNVISKERDRSLPEASPFNADASIDQQSLLILGTSDGQRLALPISQVARLEQIPKTSVERANNQEVVQYRSEILPLIRLAKFLGLKSHEDPDDPQLNVVVYTEDARSVGLVVDRIIDIVKTTLEVSCQSRHQGLLGSAVIQERVTDVVDLPAVIRQLDVPNQAAVCLN